MKLLLDTANLGDIKRIREHFPIVGVTTNPTILAKEGGDLKALLLAIREILGSELELHVQVTSTDYEEILKEANAQATRTLERAEEQIELEKKRALNEVKNEVSSMAIGIASAVIERDISEDEHKALIDDFINTIGNE